MNRVAERGIVFRERWTTELFLHLLQDLDQRFSVECHAYCLMGNHYHLLLRTPEPNLGRAMRHFNGLFTHLIDSTVATASQGLQYCPKWMLKFSSFNSALRSHAVEMIVYLLLVVGTMGGAWYWIHDPVAESITMNQLAGRLH